MNGRESQINALAAAIYVGASKLEDAHKEAEGYISRAEQRVRGECGEEISSLRNTLSKCKALTDELTSPECSLSFLSNDALEGLRIYVKRIKAERSRDSERLDWLLARSHYGIPGFDPCVRGRTPEKRKADLIRAIDTARGAGE